MEQKISYRVPYPDISNTRYSSHGEAAAIILVYHSSFLSFRTLLTTVLSLVTGLVPVLLLVVVSALGSVLPLVGGLLGNLGGLGGLLGSG